MIQLGFCVNDHFYDYLCVYDYIEDSKNKPNQSDDTRSNLWCRSRRPHYPPAFEP